MTKYVSFCTTSGAYNAYKIMCQNVPRYTRREYKELLGMMIPRVISGARGVYALVFRVKDNGTPVRVFRVDIVSSPEWYPTIMTEVYINDKLVRTFYFAE